MNEKAIKSLLQPSAYPEPTSSVRFLQTHISYLFITDNFVYKIKKAVDFGFLNFTTLDRRRFYCEEEVRLNRRLCPEIYLGMVALKETATGGSFFGEGKIIEYAVKMKRLPEERMLCRLLAENGVTAADMRKLAHKIAGFHLNAERGDEIDCYGSLETLECNWAENFSQAAAIVDMGLTKLDLSIIRSWVADFMALHAELFAERVSRGFIRDCDGDIHSENICLANEKVYIFDCIEFSPRFRYTDTAADIAFLLMDLDYHMQTPLAEIFLDEYIKATRDNGVVQVLDFYKIYRAFVRGKVESLRRQDENIPDSDREVAARKAYRYFRLARGYILRKRLRPCLIITCGLMGSGKSAIASELAFELGVEVLSSDRVRKEIAAIPPTTHWHAGYDQGIYTSSYNKATYSELRKRANKILGEGNGCIIDATFRKKHDRAQFHRLAKMLDVPFYIVETVSPEAIIRERLESRIQKPDEISDGRWELFHRQKEEFEPVAENEGEHVVVDTSRGMVENIDEILRSLGVLYDVD
jgi:aminoglycoside phosphotransferase family enzyme/predicted kinase